MQPMPVNREVLDMSKERPILFSGPMVRAILEGRKTQTRRVCVMPWKGRRVIQSSDDGEWYDADCISPGRKVKCPYGVPGDRLWIRESGELLRNAYDHNPATGNDLWRDVGWRFPDGSLRESRINEVPLDEFVGDCAAIRRPSIHMPRWASRLTLEVKAVRVEQLQEISEADAIAEGATRREIHGHSAGWSMDWSRVGQLSRFAGGIHQRGNEQPLTDRDVCLGSARMAFGALWNSINGKRGRGWEANPWVWVVEFERVQP